MSIACMGMLAIGPCPALAIEPIQVQYQWQINPQLDFVWEEAPYISLVDVTPARLNSESATTRMRAVQDLLRVPNSPRLNRAEVLEAILQRLEAGEPHATVRAQLCAAACELDDGTHAEQLWKAAQDHPEARRAVERACIGWRTSAPLEQWRTTLAATSSSEQDLLFAVDGIGATGAESDMPVLEQLVLDATRSPGLRLRAAKAVGSVADGDRLPLAKKLVESQAAQSQCMAIDVLARSPAASVSEFVQEIALHGPPPAQRAAYQWLCQHDSSTAERLAGQFLNHVDSAVRELALRQMKAADNEQTMPALFAAFHDEHPMLRVMARELLLQHCGDAQSRIDTAIQQTEQFLGAEDWRALEQSIRLTVEFKLKQQSQRLLELLNHPRPEVCITAGWALCRLGDDEQTLAQMLVHVEAITAKLAAGDPATTEVDLRRTAHLLEAFGLRNYQPAKDVALQYVPKKFTMGLITRMAGIWTCGKLWERSENKQLIAQLHERIADKNTQFPESPSVRFTATLALGWIADAESRQPLIKCDEAKPAPIGYATEWALGRIDQK